MFGNRGRELDLIQFPSGILPNHALGDVPDDGSGDVGDGDGDAPVSQLPKKFPTRLTLSSLAFIPVPKSRDGGDGDAMPCSDLTRPTFHEISGFLVLRDDDGGRYFVVQGNRESGSPGDDGNGSVMEPVCGSASGSNRGNAAKRPISERP